MVALALLALTLSAATEQAPHPERTDHSVAKQGSAKSATQDSTKPPAPTTRAPAGAEERLATYTLVLTVFTGGLFVANVLLWLSTQSTLKHLRQEFEAQHRPWIPPDIHLDSAWTWTPEGDGHVTLRFDLRNIGRSPATNVDVHTEMFPRWGFPEPAAAQKKLAESKRRDLNAPGEAAGWTIFPGEPAKSLGMSVSISAADLETSRLAFKEKFPETSITTVTPIIIGCITYRFLGKQHQTGFVLKLKAKNEAPPNDDFALDPVQGNIPIERLELRDAYLGNAVID